MNHPKIPRLEWNFDSVPDSELVACCVWEYARESASLRDAVERWTNSTQYIEMIRIVRSSFIRAVGYDDNTLYVEMENGKTYAHPNVPYSVYERLMNASSPGTYYNQHIRGRY